MTPGSWYSSSTGSIPSRRESAPSRSPMTREVRYGSHSGTSQPPRRAGSTAQQRPAEHGSLRLAPSGTAACRRACRRRGAQPRSRSSGEREAARRTIAGAGEQDRGQGQPDPDQHRHRQPARAASRRMLTPSAEIERPARPPGAHRPGTPAGSNGSAWSGSTRAGPAGRRSSPAGSRASGSGLAASPARRRWPPAAGPTRDRRPGSKRPGNSRGTRRAPPCPVASRWTICLPDREPEELAVARRC